MNAIITPERQNLSQTLDEAIMQHGALRVFLAALRRLVLPAPDARRRRLDGPLSDHIRRDIGLPPDG